MKAKLESSQLHNWAPTDAFNWQVHSRSESLGLTSGAPPSLCANSRCEANSGGTVIVKTKERNSSDHNSLALCKSSSEPCPAASFGGTSWAMCVHVPFCKKQKNFLYLKTIGPLLFFFCVVIFIYLFFKPSSV